ncbi:hypothetical protein [Nocardia terpenica]|uniref:Uncharacterized protein n=1 Tax=Nocardia terpenica TaxID=455432 RepID=A0A291RDB5_9NOCA|nr:hypothetical protein [Nocardia terpenica]ATL65102.1 hypothetical protein CRH09_01520 [Nocardia terpenica]
MFTINQAALHTIADAYDAGLHTAYSGRGMYGTGCVGFSTDTSGAATAIAFELACALAEQEEGEDYDVIAVRDYLGELTGSQYCESLGRGLITYWTGLRVAQE